MVEMQVVASSSVHSVGYDAGERELYVRFRDGEHIYVYAGVGKDVFEAFLVAESKGAFVNREIKPAYPVRRLTAP